jgi:hypothetical protein
VASGAAVLAQSSLRGTVRDESGALVAGANVSLIDESKGVVRGSESDSGGSFLITPVIAGRYSVRVEKEGFNTERIEGLWIDVGEQASLPITLHVGARRTEITVQAPSATDLDAESNTLGSVVDFSRVQDLPLNGRHFLELAELLAAARNVSPASNLFSTNIGPPGRTIILPGTLPNAVNYYLNGINVTGSRDGELALSPSIAGIDQFTVQESFVMPDQGINPALVNIVTRSGSNEVHGEAYEFFRNRALDARSFFAATRDDVKLNQFGGALGGPIRKNRVWFHAFYEGLRQLTAFSASGYTPTAAMFVGNFSGTGAVLYDPASYNAATNTRAPFPGGSRIPPDRIKTVSRNLLGYYVPGSSLASIPSNVFGSLRNTLDDDQGGFRLDAALNPRSQLFGQFFHQKSPSDRPGLFPFSGLLYLNSADIAMIQHTASLSPRAVNVLRLGFVRNEAVGGNEAQENGPDPASIGIANTIATKGVTAINLQGYSSFGRSNGEIGNRDNTWQIDQEFTYGRGSHVFAAGAGLVYRRGWHLNGNGSALGALSFQPVFTAQLAKNPRGQVAPVPNSGNSFADFLLGLPVTGMLNGLPVVQLRSTQFTPYVQDAWRLSPNLTINYGVSWFLETPPEPYGWARQYVHSFDFSSGLLAFAALPQTTYRAVVTDKNNVSPRLGLAWKPALLKGAVLRAGAGLYYSNVPWVLAANSVQGPPAGVGQTFSNPQSNPLPAYVLGVNIFSPRPSAPLTDTYAAGLPPGTTVQAIDPNFRTASTSHWNVSVERSIGLKDSFEVDYLGSSGHHLPYLLDASQCRPTATLYCDPSTRPHPRYGLLLYTNSSGNSSYHALVAKYDHRLNSDLNVHIEYAFAKALTDSWQSSLAANQISDCRRCSKGPATFDVRHKAVGSIVWNLPSVPANFPRWADVARDWTLSAIVTLATGQPVLLTAPNQTGSAFIRPLPNRICDGRSNDLASNVRNNGMLWFNTACFPVPLAGYFGSSGPTVLSGPGVNNWDVGVQKSFEMGWEMARLQLRAEMFNAWNHAQFDQPNGNAGAGATFGRISATLPPRLVQISLKLLW